MNFSFNVRSWSTIVENAHHFTTSTTSTTWCVMLLFFSSLLIIISISGHHHHHYFHFHCSLWLFTQCDCEQLWHPTIRGSKDETKKVRKRSTKKWTLNGGWALTTFSFWWCQSWVGGHTFLVKLTHFILCLTFFYFPLSYFLFCWSSQIA